MDSLTGIAASGMRARLQALDVLANNIANASSKGYKAEVEIHNLYSSADAFDPKSGEGGQHPWIDDSWTDFSQGTVLPTGSPLDLALVGKGFVTVRGPAGNLYTRNGTLKVSPQGDLLAPEDRAILDKNNKPIKIDPSLPFDIDTAGAVKQNNQTVAELAIVEFTDASALRKLGKSYFQLPPGKVQPKPAADTAVRQGHVESSNVTPSESAVRLVAMLREFEMLKKAIELGSRMTEQSIEQVAKVNS
jgi:flagellar basal body rod protein FlgG